MLDHGSKCGASACWCCRNALGRVGFWTANCQATEDAVRDWNEGCGTTLRHAQNFYTAPGRRLPSRRPSTPLAFVSTFLRFLHGGLCLELFLPNELLGRTLGQGCFGLASRLKTTLRHHRPVVTWSWRFQRCSMKCLRHRTTDDYLCKHKVDDLEGQHGTLKAQQCPATSRE